MQMHCSGHFSSRGRDAYKTGYHNVCTGGQPPSTPCGSALTTLLLLPTSCSRGWLFVSLCL